MGPNDRSRRFDRPRHWLLHRSRFFDGFGMGGQPQDTKHCGRRRRNQFRGAPALSTSPVHEHAHQVGYRKYNGHKSESWR